jgi:hypothetical protein
MLAAGEGGEHGERLRQRNQYRLVYRTKDFPKDLDELAAEDTKLSSVLKALGEMVIEKEHPKNKWYSSTADVDIPVINESDPDDVRPLSQYSHLLRDFVSQSPTFLFVRPEDAEKARSIVKSIVKVEALEVISDEPKLKPAQPAQATRESVKGGDPNVGHTA